MTADAKPARAKEWKEFLLVALALTAILSLLFFKSFLPGYVHFSNDGPLGVQVADAFRLPEGFRGVWIDLNWLGANGGAFSYCVTSLIKLCLGPVGFAKFLAPVALLWLGLCAWLFFKRLKLTSSACFLAALATALNSTFFSTACWGVAAQPIAFGWNYLALALLVSDSPTGPSLRNWLRCALAGLAVGMNLMEAADIGAIFSLFIAAFVMFEALVSEGAWVLRLARGVARVAVVAVFAALMAAQTLSSLWGSAIKGVAGMEQDVETKAQRWDWATQWSQRKLETLGLIIPGLFGYRMDTPGGGQYWGKSGRDPAWDRYFASGKQDEPPAGFIRQSGGGGYVGGLVALVVAWTVAQSFRRKEPLFTVTNRRLVWFWTSVLVVTLLLAFGRFAPFYQFLYALPYFSTIRSPSKFMHVFTWALMILFAYGAHGLARRYLEVPATPFSKLSVHLRSSWAKAGAFDKRWTIATTGAIAISFFGWLIYASYQPALEAYLQTVQFDEGAARAIASFSIRQVGWFILFLTLAVGALTLVLSGAFAGTRARWGAALLGTLLVVDLARANLPWTVFWNYKVKYATNPIIDRLRERPYAHRVALFPEWILRAFRMPEQVVAAEEYFSRGLYGIEWLQQLFPYYNIQSLDLVQMPRAPKDFKAFETALAPTSADTLCLATRHWELTNTRYLLGLATFTDFLNNQFDPVRRRFRVAERFNIVFKLGVSRPTRLEELAAEPATNGVYALIEFTGALPRAKLYAHWQVSANDQATLKELAGPTFDPAQTVLVAEGVPGPPSAATNQNAGTVEFVSYAPTRILLKAQATSPAVLLLNDKYDPAWQVRVDGKSENLLRCNFIMRGVYVPPGTHVVEFAFKPSLNSAYVSLAGLGVGLLLAGILAFYPRSPEPAAERSGSSAATVLNHSTKPAKSVGK